jgi:transcription elongation factor GreA
MTRILFFLLFQSVNNMANVIYITEEGLSSIKKELENLRTVERPAISRQIAEARDKGDLSENAEYDAAKEAQGLLEMKIARLEEQVAGARIIDESRIDTDSVQVLNRVKIKNKNNNTTLEYVLVPESEANLKLGKIAVSTPIARGLLGKKVGEVVEISIPSGKVQYEIMEISR